MLKLQTWGTPPPPSQKHSAVIPPARKHAWPQILAMAVAFGPGFSAAVPSAAGQQVAGTVYRSPFQLAFSPDGRRLAVSDPTGGSLILLEASTGRVVREIKLGGRPAGVVWSADGRFVYTADRAGRTVVQIHVADQTIIRLAAGPRPVGLALAPQQRLLLAANSAGDSISLLDPTGRQPPRQKPAGNVPYLLAVTPDESLAVVGNRLPLGDAFDPALSATVTLVDLQSDRAAVQVRLRPNGTNVCGVAVSPDGRWAYVVHNLARAMLPTEQIEYGWINANAMTVIDLGRRRRYATVLLDRFDAGAANPFGAAVSPDGSTLWVTLSGMHQVGRIDLVRLHSLLSNQVADDTPQQEDAATEKPGSSTARGSMRYSDSWRIGVEDPTSVELVVADLPVEYGHGRYLGKVFFRADLPGNGPRGLAISPDGRRVAVAMYYSGTVAFVDAATFEVTGSAAVAPQPPADDARRGEMIFHDAKYCFQHWLSCSTCHPDGRTDGLNWDLMNDGIGNPKNTRSLVLSHRTPPAMSRGVRPGMPEAAAAGFKFLLFQEPKANELRAVEAYLRSLAPQGSPRLAGGRLSEKARRGKVIFDGTRAGCSRCHPAPLYTDLRMHDVGTNEQPDEPGRFDTPTLVELWRTAPYLHHGRAASLRQVLTTMNPSDKHGHTSHLSDDETGALVEYLQSL